MKRSFSRVGQGQVDVSAFLNDELTEPPVAVESRGVEAQIVS